MPLNAPLLKILEKIYEPSALVEIRHGKHDILLKTNGEGKPILLFLGKKAANGLIKGERYARKLKIDDRTGAIIKDHWECKGKATA